MRRVILFLQGTVGFGGSKASLLTLVQMLPELGYRPVVASPGPGWLTEQLDRFQVPWLPLPFYAWRTLLQRPMVGWSIRRRWLPALKSLAPALVHSNEFWWTPHAVRLGKLLHIPVVTHLRAGTHSVQKARQYLLQDTDTILTVSTDVRDRLASDPLLHSKALVFFNGYELDQLDLAGQRETARREYGLQAGELGIANVGLLCENKNQRFLLQTFAHLLQTKKLPPCKLFFAGPAEPDYERALRRDIANLKLEPVTRLLGRVEPIEKLLTAVDLVVHCAKQEGLPRVVVEAMLLGKPVVTTATGGVRDAIPDARFGSIVPVDDRTALAEEILRFLSDAGLREQVGAAGLKMARQLFSMASCRARLQTLYGRLLQDTAR